MKEEIKIIVKLVPLYQCACCLTKKQGSPSMHLNTDNLGYAAAWLNANKLNSSSHYMPIFWAKTDEGFICGECLKNRENNLNLLENK